MRTSIRKFTTITTAVALAFGATFTLSGCFGNPLENLAQGGASEFIKNATGADVELGGKSVPKSFPQQVPLVNGDVVHGASLKAEGKTIWTVRLSVKDPAIFEKIQSQMSGAGFEESFSTEGENQMGSFEGKGYGVLVNVDSIDGKVGVTYLVSEIDDED